VLMPGGGGGLAINPLLLDFLRRQSLSAAGVEGISAATGIGVIEGNDPALFLLCSPHWYEAV